MRDKRTEHHPFSPIQSLLASVLLSGATLASVAVAFGCQFYVNDDVAIHNMLSGAISGEPSAYGVHPNILFCLPVSWLYAAFPGLNWWFVAMVAVQVLALAAFDYLIVRFGGLAATAWVQDMAEMPFRVLVLAAAAFLGAVVFAVPLALADYTFAAASFSAAGCSLLVASALLRERMSAAECRALVIFSVAFIVSAYLVRYQGGLIGLAFFAMISCAVACLGHGRGVSLADRMKDFAPFCVALVLVAGSWGVQAIAYSTAEWKAYVDFNEIRTEFTDYPHDSFDENPELYRSVGWDKPLCELLQGWFMMDERMNAEAFAVLTAGAHSAEGQNAFGALARDSLGFGMYTLAAYLGMLAVLCLWCCQMGRGISRWLSVALTLAAVAIIGYVCLEGRFMYRAALCGVLPGLFSTVVCACHAALQDVEEQAASGDTAALLGGRSSGKWLVFAGIALVGAVGVVATGLLLFSGRHGVSLTIVAMAGAVGLCMAIGCRHAGAHDAGMALTVVLVVLGLVLGVAAQEDIRNQQEDSAVSDREAVAMADYAADHPDEFFICSLTVVPADPAVTMPRNARGWGGWTYHTPTWDKLARDYGYPQGLYARSLLDDGVFFATPDPSYVDLFIRYFDELGYRVKATERARLDAGVVVYEFLRL